MKKLLSPTIFVVCFAFAGVGCNSGTEAELSKDQIDALKNPSKTIPPEAAAGMAQQGELMKKQAEANKAAGVDSRGVPIGKAAGGNAPPPPGGG